eukprot:g51675.t1
MPMLATSFTSAVAFWGNCFTKIPPIRQFGFFLGNLVAVNYILVVTYVPALILFHDGTERLFNQCCCKRCRKPDDAFDDGFVPEDDAFDDGFVPEAISPSPKPETDTLSSRKSVCLSKPDKISEENEGTPLPTGEISDETGKEQNVGPVDSEDIKEEPSAPTPMLGTISKKGSVFGATLREVQKKGFQFGSGHDSEEMKKAKKAVVRINEAEGDWFFVKYFVVLYKCRWVVLLITVVVVLWLGAQIPKIRAPDGLPQLFPDDHNIQLLSKAGGSGSGSGTYTGVDAHWPLLDGVRFPIYPLPDVSNSTEVLNRPGNPRGVSVTVTGTATSPTLLVSWVVPSFTGSGTLQGYTVARGRAFNVSGSMKVVQWSETLTSTQLRGQVSLTLSGSISVASTHGVRVVAFNSYGFGFPSEVAFVDIPSPYPGISHGVSATKVGPTSPRAANFVWQAPPAHSMGFAVTGYKPQYRLSGTSSWTSMEFQSLASLSSLQYRFESLCAGKAYEFRVLARNLNGYSYGDTTSAKADVKSATLDVYVPTAPYFDSSVANVSWDHVGVGVIAPDCDGGASITGYQYQTSSDGSNWGTLKSLTVANSAYFQVAWPEQSVVYIRVRALNGQTPNNDFWVQTSATTLDAQPAAPTAVSATSLGISRVKVAWNPPTYVGKATLLGFLVEWSVNGVSWTSQYVTGGSVKTVNITGLSPSTTYTFRVKASNELTVYGATSTTASTTTNTLAPNPPILVFRRRQLVDFEYDGSDMSDGPINRYATPAHIFMVRRHLASPLSPTTPQETGFGTSAYSVPTKTISWSSSGGSSPITGYQFRQRKATCSGNGPNISLTAFWYPFQIEGCTSCPTSYSMQLRYGSSYEIGVRAFNGEWSDWAVGCITAISSKPEPPSSVAFGNIQTQSAQLSWALGYENGAALTSHTVSYQANGGAVTKVQLGPGATSYTISGLEPNTLVSGCVVANNSMGQSTPATCATQVSTLDAPVLQLTDMDDATNTLNLTLSPYSATNNFVTSIAVNNLGTATITVTGVTFTGSNTPNQPWTFPLPDFPPSPPLLLYFLTFPLPDFPTSPLLLLCFLTFSLPDFPPSPPLLLYFLTFSSGLSAISTATPFTVTGGQTKTISITYSRSVYYHYTHTLNIVHTGTNPTITATVNARYLFPQISLSTSVLDIKVAKSGSAQATLVVTNTGEATCTVTMAYPTVTSQVSQVVASPAQPVLAAGQSRSISLTFAVGGSYSGATSLEKNLTVTFSVANLVRRC